MKKLLLYIIPLFLVFSSCDLIDSDPEDPKTGYISGFVFSSDDIPMGGVKIESGSQSVLTANDGSYFLSDVNVSDRALVKLSENATICEMFKLIRVKENDTSSCNFVVPGSGKFEKVNSSDKTISNIKGKLEIQKNTVVYEDGSEVNEDVFCTVSFISPAEENFKDRFPGEFIGVDYQGEEKDITPVSCLYAGLSTTSGKKVKIKDGEVAKYEIPIPDHELANAPNTIAMYYFDEEKAKWIQDGSATRIGDKYLASLPHFSYWMSAYHWNRAYLEGYVYMPNGSRASDAFVVVEGIDYIGKNTEWTDKNGYFKIAVKNLANVKVYAMEDNYYSEPVEIKAPVWNTTLKIDDIRLKERTDIFWECDITGEINLRYETWDNIPQMVNGQYTLWSLMNKNGKKHSMFFTKKVDKEGSLSIPDEISFFFAEGNILEFEDIGRTYEAVSGTVFEDEYSITFSYKAKNLEDSTKFIEISNGKAEIK